MQFRLFDDEICAVEMRKINPLINKPTYAGFTILELSKLQMYKFHYDVIKKNFGNKAELLMTDTDSLVYQFNFGLPVISPPRTLPEPDRIENPVTISQAARFVDQVVRDVEREMEEENRPKVFDDIYKWMFENKNYFDTSNYPKQSFLYEAT